MQELLSFCQSLSDNRTVPSVGEEFCGAKCVITLYYVTMFMFQIWCLCKFSCHCMYENVMALVLQ